MTAIEMEVLHGCARATRRPASPTRVGGRIKRALDILREWRRRIREREELAALDDRMLRDIGLTRADARYLISKPFWRE